MLSEENGNVIGIVAVVVILFFTALGLVTFGIYSFTDDYARNTKTEDETRARNRVQSPKQAGGEPSFSPAVAKQAPSKKSTEQQVFVPAGRGNAKPSPSANTSVQTVVHRPNSPATTSLPATKPAPEAAPQPFVPKSQPGTLEWVKEMCEHESLVLSLSVDDKTTDLLVELDAPSGKTLAKAGPALFKATRDCMLFAKESEIEFRRMTFTAQSKIEGKKRKALELTYTRGKIHSIDFEEPVDVVKAASKAFVHKLLKEAKPVVRSISRMRQLHARLAAQRIASQRLASQRVIASRVQASRVQNCAGGS